MSFDPVFEIEAQALAEIIDQLDYFHILKIEQTATPDELKKAYFRESRAYHPDQFHSLPDSDAKKAVGKIYKRVNEAFVVLRDDRKRGKYTQDINSPDREKKLRYTDASDEELKKEREAEMGKTPQGRKMFAQGLADFDAGRHAQAIQNFRMALMYEKGNTLIQDKLDEALKATGQKK